MGFSLFETIPKVISKFALAKKPSFLSISVILTCVAKHFNFEIEMLIKVKIH